MIYGADHQNLPEPSDAFYASILRLLPWSPNVKDGMYTVREYGVFRTRKTVHSSYEIKTL